MYRAYATYESSPEARLNTLLRGAAVHPSDPDVAIALGIEYLMRGMQSEAIEHLLSAREYLGGRSDVQIDALLRMARGEQELPAEWLSPGR